MRSMVEGALDSTHRCRRKVINVGAVIALKRRRCVAARAPSTALRAVPLPR